MSTRLIRFSMIALLAGAPAFAGAQGRFEGIINAKLPNNQGMAEIEYLVKGDQVRMNVQSMGRSMFMLHDASANVMVLPEQRMYMEMPQMSGDMSNMPGARANAGK